MIKREELRKKQICSANGIDRIDSSIGYIYNNCVPCCEICNKAKRDLDRETFLLWIERLTNHIRK